MPAMTREVTSERDSLARELEELRASIRNQHEQSADLGSDHADRDQSAACAFGVISGTGEDEREDQNNDDNNDCDDGEGDSRGEESDGSAAWLRDELIHVA
jgi:hypothetical protein